MKKTLTKKELLLKIIQLQSEITSNIHNLNYGGCGRFSYLFYEELIKIYPKSKVKIVFFDNFESITKKKKTIKKIMSTWYYKMDDTYTGHISPSHCMVQIDNTLLIDGYFIHHKTKDDYCWKRSRSGYITHKELKICLEYGSWNDSYDVRQNKKLEKIIKKHLSVGEKKSLLKRLVMSK